MRGRPFAVAWGEQDTEDALNAASLAEHAGVPCSRLQARWLLESGRSHGAVTEALGVHDRTAQR
jgi:hypothetical protein